MHTRSMARYIGGKCGRYKASTESISSSSRKNMRKHDHSRSPSYRVSTESSSIMQISSEESVINTAVSKLDTEPLLDDTLLSNDTILSFSFPALSFMTVDTCIAISDSNKVKDSVKNIDFLDDSVQLEWIPKHYELLFRDWRKMENVECHRNTYARTRNDILIRAHMVNNCIHLLSTFSDAIYGEECLYLAVSILDRYFALVNHSYDIDQRDRFLITVVSLLISFKFEQVNRSNNKANKFLRHLIADSKWDFTKDDIISTEVGILRVISFQLMVPTASKFLSSYIHASKSDDMHDVVKLSYCICERALLEYKFMFYKPSLIAAAALFIARYITFNSSDIDNSSHNQYNQYNNSNRNSSCSTGTCRSSLYKKGNSNNSSDTPITSPESPFSTSANSPTLLSTSAWNDTLEHYSGYSLSDLHKFIIDFQDSCALESVYRAKLLLHIESITRKSGNRRRGSCSASSNGGCGSSSGNSSSINFMKSQLFTDNFGESGDLTKLDDEPYPACGTSIYSSSLTSSFYNNSRTFNEEIVLFDAILENKKDQYSNLVASINSKEDAIQLLNIVKL